MADLRPPITSLELLPFGELLQNVVKDAHDGLEQLAQRLPALGDEERKRELLLHLQTARQRLQRLHVCAQWAHKAKAVNACREVLKAAHDHGAAFVHAADEFFRLHEELRMSRAPLFDVSTSLHILQSGTYRLLPAVIEEELQQPGKRLERPGELSEVQRAQKRQAALRRADFLLRSKLLASELPAGLQVVRVRGGRAEVAAAGGHYTAQLTLVPSPRDDATLAKYRPPGEPDEAATGPKEEAEVAQPAAGNDQPSTSGGPAGQRVASAGAAAAAAAQQGTDAWRWQLLSFELLPAAAGHDPPPLLPAQRTWLQQHVEQRMWVAADVEQLVRLGRQAWVSVPEPPPKEPQAAGWGASLGPAPTTSPAPSQAAAAAAADSKGKRPLAEEEVGGVPGEQGAGGEEGAPRLPPSVANPLHAMHAILCQTAGRLALFSLLLGDARQLEGGSWKGCLKLSRLGEGAGSGLRLAYWQQLASLSYPELQCLREGAPYQPAAAAAVPGAAAAGAAPAAAAAAPGGQQVVPPAVELTLREDGSMAAASSPQLHHPLSGEPVQLPLPLDSPTSFSADRLLLSAAAASAAVQLAAVQAVLQRGGQLAPAGIHGELVSGSAAPAAAGEQAAPLPASPLLQLWQGGSLQLSLSTQLRSGRLLLAAGPGLLESEQGPFAAGAVAAAQQQLDQAQQSAMTQPLPPGTSRGMLAAQLAAQAVGRLSLQLSTRRRMDAVAAAAAAFGLGRATLPQRLLQQHLRQVALLLAPLSSNTLTLALPAHLPPSDLVAWSRRQQQQQQQRRPGSTGGGAGHSGATRCFMLLDLGETPAAEQQQQQQQQAAANGGGGSGSSQPQLRVLLAVCACTSRGTVTHMLQLAELPPELLREMQQAAEAEAGGAAAAASAAASRKRRASDAAANGAPPAAAAAAAAGGADLELGLAAAAAWCKREASWGALHAQLQLLPVPHAEELSLVQPQRRVVRLPRVPALAQLDPWAAAQLAPPSAGSGSVVGSGKLQAAPGTPAGADAAAQPSPPRPSATLQLEEGDAEAAAGQWRVELTSLYFARLGQLLKRQGVALAAPAADAQHVAAREGGLTLRYSLSQGHTVLTALSDLARMGMLHLCLTRLLGCMAANPLAAGAAAVAAGAAGGGGSNGGLRRPDSLDFLADGDAADPGGKANGQVHSSSCDGGVAAGAAPAWPLPGCGAVRVQEAGLTHFVLSVAPPLLAEGRQQQAQWQPVHVTVSWADTLASGSGPSGVAAQPPATSGTAVKGSSSSGGGGGSSSSRGSLKHIRCRVAAEPPLPEPVAAALEQQLEAGRIDLFLDSLCLVAHSAAAAQRQLAPEAQRAAGLLPGALRVLAPPGGAAGGSSALRLRAQLQQGQRAATLVLSFCAAGYTLLQLQPAPGVAASAAAWLQPLWQSLAAKVPTFAAVAAASPAPSDSQQQGQEQKPAAQPAQLQQAWVHCDGLAQALAGISQAVASPKAT